MAQNLMKPAKIHDVIAAIGGELVQGNIEGEITGVSTDSRTTEPGDLFFALIGENSDGHEYVVKAVENGAAAVVVSRAVEVGGMVINVPDTLVALGDLAMWHRKRFDVRVVGITGSVGKTTTKEMISAVLSTNFNVLKNAGNFNNEIGVPLTIFQLEPEHEVLIQEMAMRLPGEIAELAEIAKPDIGVITNVGLSHIERLGTQDAIAAAKAELLEHLPEDGIAVLNADDEYFDFLVGKSACDIVAYGTEKGDIRAENVKIGPDGRPRFTVAVGNVKFQVALPVVGEHNVLNALAAVAVGLCFGVPVEDIARGLDNVVLPDKRADVFESTGKYNIFDDTYNANPASMAAALRTLASMNGGRKIAVLGDMLELGDYAVAAHREIGKLAAELGVSALVTVGELGREIAVGAREAGFLGGIEEFDTSEAAGSVVRGKVQVGDVVLVKGSRGMKMENVVEALK